MKEETGGEKLKIKMAVALLFCLDENSQLIA